LETNKIYTKGVEKVTTLQNPSSAKCSALCDGRQLSKVFLKKIKVHKSLGCCANVSDFAPIPISNKRKVLVVIKKITFDKNFMSDGIICSKAGACVSDSGLLKIEKADIPIVDVLNLNNFTKYNEY